ncbi:hypothetical protein ACCD06_20645 [Azospirillum sp. CT11-132]|nr:hypothetical protein [Azospirillum sp. TSH64]
MGDRSCILHVSTLSHELLPEAGGPVRWKRPARMRIAPSIEGRRGG